MFLPADLWYSDKDGGLDGWIARLHAGHEAMSLGFIDPSNCQLRPTTFTAPIIRAYALCTPT